MFNSQTFLFKFRLTVLLALLSLTIHAQKQKDDAVRIRTDLMQTSVTVVDKDGRLVPAPPKTTEP